MTGLSDADRTTAPSTTPAVDAPGRAPLRLVLAVAAATVALDLAGAGSVSLWSDEVATISAAQRDLGDLDRMLARIDAVHGAYYVLMHGWLELVGASPFLVRVPSALAVGAAVAGVHVLGARLAGPRTGLVAAVVLALLPRATWAGIEARPSALTLAAAVACTLALHAATSRAGRRYWVVYALALAAAVAVNIYLVLLAAAHAVTLLLVRRSVRPLVPLAAATAAALVLTAPVLWRAAHQGGQLGTSRFGVLGLARNVLVNQWFLGETPTATTGSGAQTAGALEPANLWKLAAVLLALACWALVARAVVRAVRSVGVPPGAPAGAPARDPGGARVVAWALPWIAVPTALVLGGAAVSPSLYNARYLGFCTPAVALLVAAGLRGLRGRVVVGALTGVAVLAAPVYVSQRTPTAKSGADWALVAEVVAARAEPGDGVYFGPRDALPPGATTVPRSLRTIRLGYPDAFEGLRDVTRSASPEDSATLFGLAVPLASSADALEDLDVVWVVRRQDRPEAALADEALLREAGFTVRPVWDGPQTEVLEARR